MNSPILFIQSVSKWYTSGSDHLHILNDVSCSFEAGSTNILTGESGSGKTTLLNLVGGLDAVSDGSIVVENENIVDFSEKRLTRYRQEKIGFIFQFHYLLKEFSAIENVMLPCYMAGENRSNAMEKAAELLAEVGLSNRHEHFPSQLSGGERQRVAIARALINDPKIILADEPTGNLDERNSRMVEELLFSVVRRHRKTLLLVTHDVALSRKGDFALRLEGGVLKKQ